MRKVVIKGNITEERIYFGNYELFRKFVNSSLTTKRETVHIQDSKQRIATIDGDVVRYQITDHLGSALPFPSNFGKLASQYWEIGLKWKFLKKYILAIINFSLNLQTVI